MTTVFEIADGDLRSSVLGEVVSYEHVKLAVTTANVTALIDVPDFEASLEGMTVGRNLRRFDIAIADLPHDPRSGDLITIGGLGTVYRVSGAPFKDEQSIAWLIDAYEETT